MPDLLIEKSGFDICEKRLENLASSLRVERKQLDRMEDTSRTGEREQQCLEEMFQLMEALAALAEETIKNIEETKAAYVMADQ